MVPVTQHKGSGIFDDEFTRKDVGPVRPLSLENLRRFGALWNRQFFADSVEAGGVVETPGDIIEGEFRYADEPEPERLALTDGGAEEVGGG